MMTTRSVGRPAAASRGGGTGGRAGRGGGRTRCRSGNQGNGRNDGRGGQEGGQGSEVNGGVDGVPDFSTIIAQQLQNLLPTIVAQVGDQGRGQGTAAYGMSWKTLMKMMTDKYFPRNEIRKLEMELWELKVKGTDLASYTQCFQELALLCGRMYAEEADKLRNMSEVFPT
nr:reverse transcriptase domain-containing protein [Tanacetum cinerariifolium]